MEQLKKIKEWWLLIVFICGIVSAAFGLCHNILNKNNEILKTIKTTQQMALKSVIWNEEIPLAERSSACDVYLSAGYNSMTKKKCNEILNTDASQGIFLWRKL